MKDIIEPLLQPAINVGLLESDFWNMTVAEVTRYLEGAVWRMKQQAAMDYALSNLIGVSCSRMLSTEVAMPPIEDVYPDLFEEEKQQQDEEAEREASSVRNFLNFALQHNARMEQEDGEN